MFAPEVDETAQNVDINLKKKRKHYPTSESNLMQQESEELKLVNGKSHRKKRSKQRDTEKLYNKVNEPPNDDMHDEMSRIDNLPKKKKKQTEKTNHTLDLFVTEHSAKNEIIENDLKVSKDDESVTTLDSVDENVGNMKPNEGHLYKKKKKKKKVDENVGNVEPNEGRLYKKKKKKKEKADCAFELLEQPVTKHIEREVDEDQVKKPKKKKHKEKEVALQEEVVLVQKKFKKKKRSAGETVETTRVNSINEETEIIHNVDCITDHPPKKLKKHKHKDKVQELSISDNSPIKLKKKKHAKNVAVSEDTQVSFVLDNSGHEYVKSAEEVAHRKTKKRKHDARLNEDAFNKKHKRHKTVHSAEENVDDTDNSAIDHSIKLEKLLRTDSSLSLKQLADSSSEGSSIQRNNTASSESVSDDTYTLEIHEDDTHSILNETVSSNDVTQEKLNPKQQYSSDDNVDSEDVLETEIKINQCSEIANSVKSDVNVHRTGADISVKATTSKKEHLSYKKLLEQVEDKSQSKENCNQTCMSITMPWPVPPLHRIETRVCGRPTKEQRIKMKALGMDIKLGIFTKNEDDQIKNNWKEFCQLHDLPDEDPSPFINFVQAKGTLILPTEERINFVRFLAHGLSNRPLFSVYKRFQRLFLANKIVTGRFSQKEDEIIRKYMKCTSRRTPYSDLAKILNRDRLAVEKRFKALECKDDSLRWEKENIEEFIKYMLEITGNNSLSALKDREIKSQEWKLLSKKLNISTTKLQRAWVCTIHPRLFIREKVSSNAIKVALIKKLIESNANDWRAVDWEQIAKDFDGFTGRKLNKFIKDSVTYHVPQDMQNNLGECLRYLEKLCSEKKIFSKRTIKKLNIHVSF